MIWTVDELVNIIRCGEKVVIDYVMGGLSDDKNDDLFSDENFSLLWGVLGVAGINGTDEIAQRKIWECLKKNNVLSAFDKELLADFTQCIGKDIADHRLKAWNGLDNFGANLLFKKKILRPLVKLNKAYAYDVNMQAFNPIRVIGLLDRIELNDDIKEMLLHVKGNCDAGCVCGEEIINNYEKEKMLMKICEFLSFKKRKLKQHEKVFFFNYLRGAIEGGFDPVRIGINDDVVSKLVADDDKDRLSENEISELMQYNNDLIEFVMTIDKNDGFYEKVAVKMMDFDLSLFQMLYDRCIALIDSPSPKGVIFALELINKSKIKSAVKILMELSKRGKATEMAAFMHRLLPCVEGSEAMIMNILRFNLMQLKKSDKYNNKSALGEYVARVYLIAIKCFVEADLLKEATSLIVEIVKDGWVVNEYLENEYGTLMNDVILRDVSLGGALIPWSNILNLKVFQYKDKVVLGRSKDELLLRDMIVDDLYSISKEDGDEYIENDEDVKNLGSGDDEYRDGEESIINDTEKDATEILNVESDNICAEIKNEDLGNVMVNAVENKNETLIIDELRENDVNGDDVVIVKDVFYTSDDDRNMDVLKDEVQLEINKDSVNNENKDEIEEVSDENDVSGGESNDDENEGKIDGLNERIDNVINKWKEIDFGALNNIKNNGLKFNIKDLDKHFEKVKRIADNVVDKAEDVSNQIKENVKNSNLSELKSVNSIKEIAKKIKFKKD